jgi:hypothetical protein
MGLGSLSCHAGMAATGWTVRPHDYIYRQTFASVDEFLTARTAASLDEESGSNSGPKSS